MKFELANAINAPEDFEILRYVTYNIYDFETSYPEGSEEEFMAQEWSDGCLLAFKRRYIQELIDDPCTYTEFMSNKEIIETLDALNLDHNRFWLLFLYVFDFTMGEFVDGMETKPSGMTQVDNYINSLNDILLDEYDKLTDSFFTKKVSLELKFHTRGKSNVVIDNQRVILFIKRIFEQNYDLMNKTKNMHSCALKSWESDISSRSVHIVSFYKMFDRALSNINKMKELNMYDNEKPVSSDSKVNKMLFISRLIFLAGLSSNRSFYDDEDCIKGFLSQYKGLKSSHVNSYYD